MLDYFILNIPDGLYQQLFVKQKQVVGAWSDGSENELVHCYDQADIGRFFREKSTAGQPRVPNSTLRIFTPWIQFRYFRVQNGNGILNYFDMIKLWKALRQKLK
jgi:hypothetical protein